MTTHTILQISDLHLLPEAGATMLGIDTEHYFHRVLDQAFASGADIDMMLLTGDLAQHPALASYQRLAEKLQNYATPCMCLPGNHDDDALMRQALNTALVGCGKQMLLGNWQVVALNSQVPGQPGGRLDAEELRFLEDCLRAYPQRQALIAVHHPCQPIDSPWLDTMRIENGEEFLALLRHYPAVKAVVCGHAHQEIDQQAGPIRLLGAPSTCFQFEPESAAFSVADTAPGYRLLYLHADGGLKTAVYRLPEALSGLQANADPY